MLLENFFQFGPLPTDQMTGVYDIRLIILSYIVATLASYIALDITGRLRDSGNTERSLTLWLFGGAIAMGAGIWSMHFIGMLAFSMPMPMIYDINWTAFSMVVAIAASWFALFLLKSKSINLIRILFGGVILGFAIAAMHYTGMAAMTVNMNIHYLPSLFFLSIVIAILASQAALWLALKSTQVVRNLRFRLKFVSAFIMGAAICGMHYTGMAAAIFTPKPMMMHGGTLNPEYLAINVTMVTAIILGVAFIASTYKESLNQQQLLTARQAGMAEVAASVLHNVGNVLNSVNVSSSLIAEKLTQSRLSDLSSLSALINENKHDLNHFIQNDDRGKHLIDYLNSLANYWKKEQVDLLTETNMLIKNIEHIRNIIATQQDFSRTYDFEQIESIEKIISESFLISGVDNPKYEIQIVKKYDNLKPTLIDKVKLLQIMVNLLQNAKDALLEVEGNSEKMLIIEIKKLKNKFSIRVIDNGVGVANENKVKIFGYGFTTKKSGHGYGLHTSAISAKEMGGELTMESKGIGYGATFILTLPYKDE